MRRSERLRAVVDFEAFRAELEATLPRADRSRGGRPPYDAVLMFRVLVVWFAVVALIVLAGWVA